MVKDILLKYRLFLLAFVSTALFYIVYWSIFSTNYASKIPTFQKKFTQLEQKLDHFLDFKLDELKKNGELGNWKNYDENAPFNLHVYRNDSLLYWNTNQLPIIRFADIHFPSEGIIHLQNGWYYTKIFEEEQYTVCASFLIKHDYSYENKDLINDFVPSLRVPFDASISVEQVPEYSIFSKEKVFLFSLSPIKHQNIKESESQVLLFLLLGCIALWFFALFRFIKSVSKSYRWIIILAILGLRVLSLHFVWFGFMHDTHAFQASLYGTNEWFPNFFEYLTNCMVIVFFIFFLKFEFQNTHNLKNGKLISYLLFILNIPLWAFILYLNKGLIENSSIPLIIDRLFSLNVYSILALVSIGVLFYSYYVFTGAVVRLNKSFQNSGSYLATLSFILGILFLFTRYISDINCFSLHYFHCFF